MVRVWVEKRPYEMNPQGRAGVYLVTPKANYKIDMPP